MVRGRVAPIVVVCALVTGLGVAGAGEALAAPVTTSPDARVWQTDGRVDAVTYSPDGNTLFLGGIFHHLCPPAEAVCDGTGSGDVAVDYLAAVDANTGAPITSWRPEPDGEVSALAPSADGTLYAGGAFNNLAGQKHRKLVAIIAATGAPIASWKPAINSAVKALALSPDGSIVYAGGAFTTIDGASRPRMAAMSAYSAATPTEVLQPWSPAPSGTNTIDKGSLMPTSINSLVVRPDGQVYAAGVFTTIGGLTRNNVAALAPATGADPGTAIPGFALAPALSFVALNVTLTRDGTTMFVNGRGPGGFVIAANSATGAQLWSRHFDGDVQAAAATDTLIYVGGHFDYISLPKTSVRDERHHLAALDTLTGKTDPWNPRANSAFGVYGLGWSPGHIAAGGDFTQVQFLPHAGLAQFSGGDTVPPMAVGDLSVSSTVKGRVDLSWTASTDSDSDTLTYRIYRRPAGGTYAVLDTITGPSSATATGPLTYSDATATIGSTYHYQVRAADPVFLGPAGNDAGPVTVVGDQSPPGVPTGVIATSTSAGNALVTWTGAGDGDDATLAYTVTRLTGTTVSEVGVVTGTATGALSFQDSSSAGGTFSYTVRASDGTFTSAESTATAPVAVAPDSTVPAVPASVVATSTTPNTVVLIWAASSDPDQNASQISYVVYRKLAGATGTGSQIARTSPGQTTLTDTTDGTTAPLPDKSYTYYLAATDGPNTSPKTTGATTTVDSSIFTGDLSSLSGWTLPTKNNGVTLDTTQGHLSPPSAQLIGQVNPALAGYANRGFGGGYRTVCVKEWVSMTAYDTRSNAQTTLLRTFSTTGNDIARLYADQKGRLWIRSDWASSPNLTPAVIPTDGTWHSVQLCVTTTANATDGTMTAWYDTTKYGPITGLDNSTDPLGTVDIGERSPANFTMHIDDISAGTTPR